MDIEQVVIDQANINNLKNLWKKYGSTILNNKLGCKSAFNINTHWPHRCWLDGQDQINILPWLSDIPESAILPIWPESNKEQTSEFSIEKQLVSANWQCMLEQTAMYLPLIALGDNQKVIFQAKRSGFILKKVEIAQEIISWIEVVRSSFGYSIDYGVIESLLDDSEVKILMAYYHDEAIASAILFKTGDTIGVHQIGVKPSFQGQGFARDLMKELIEICWSWRGKNLVLQASKVGKPLYKSLGFNTQFVLKSYQKKTV